MININRFQSNTFVLSLYEDVTYVNPYYIFEWEDIYKRKVVFSLVDDSSVKTSYNKFTFIDGSVGSLYIQASGKLNVYESPHDASTIDASMNLLFSDDYKFIDFKPAESIFDPSIYEDFVFDPSAIGQYAKNQDFVFDPLFTAGGANTPYQVNSSQIIQDSTHRFVSDACIAYLNVLPTTIYVNAADASIYAYMNASLGARDGAIFDVYQYTDASLLRRDASLFALKLYTDGSLYLRDVSLYNLRQYTDASLYARDASLEYLFTHQVGTSVEYVDGSLYRRDVSIAYLNADKARYLYVDGSFNLRDVSINNLVIWNNSEDSSIDILRKENINQDASIVILRNWHIQEDVSIDILRNEDLNIDASIQILRNWEANQDASIQILRNWEAQQDASIDILRNEDLNIDASIVILRNWEANQDASIQILRNWEANQDASIQILRDWNIAEDISINWLNVNKLEQSDLSTYTRFNYVDASLNIKTSFIYVDNSLNARDVSIAWIFDHMTPSNLTLAYVDGSLAFRDSSIADIWTFMGGGNKTYIDASLNARDISINWLNSNKVNNASLNLFASLIYTDGSLNVKANITYVDSSLNNKVNNASLNLFASLIYVDGSLNTKANITYVDASLAFRDSSIAALWIYNGSLNAANKVYVDGSLTSRDVSINWLNINKQPIGNYIRDASLGNTLYWHAGVFDASIVPDVTKLYVDGSLALRDASIAWIQSNATTSLQALTDVSINNVFDFNVLIYESSISKWINVPSIDLSTYEWVTFAYVDGSFATNSSVNSALLTNSNKVNYIDACLGPTSVLAFSTNASLSAYATNSSVNSAFYTNASLGYLTAKVISLDACLGPTTVLTYSNNVSIGNITNRIISIDTSLGSNWILTNALNASTLIYATNASVNSAFLTNSSLGTLTTKVNYIDACLGTTAVLAFSTNASLSAYATNASVNLAIGGIDFSSYATNSSVNTAFLTNSSLGTLTTKVNYIDACLGTTSKLTYSINASISAYATNASIGLVDFVKGVSLNGFATNVSIGLALFVKEASLNVSKFKWTGGYLEPSILTGGGGTLVSLTDVSVANPSTGQILSYNTSYAKWESKTINASLYDVVNASDYFWIFSDVSITSPLNNQVLAYDTTSAKFKNQTVNASMYNIVNASDYVQLRLQWNSPSTGAAGLMGDWNYDASYLYICTSTNKWMRILGVTGY